MESLTGPRARLWGQALLLGGAALVLTGCALALMVDKAYCPPGFECEMVTVPVDHFAPDSHRTIEVPFAVRPAGGERRGVLVTAVGGPGTTALDTAEFRVEGFPDSILDHFDLVYFDQRGLHEFPSPACPEADSAWSEAYYELPPEDPERWEGLRELSREYNQACVDESPHRDLLPYLGTEQVVRDLEVFRGQRGYERLVIYGESYGTVVAQEYAGTFPDRVERLVLDGPVDRTRDSLEQLVDQMIATEKVLEMVFAACDLDPVCAADMGSPASVAYADLIRRLTDDPVTVVFPVEPDVFEEWPLVAEDVSYLAFSSTYFEEDRQIFLRALAHATRGEYIPMVRLWGLSGGGLSSMVNLAVTCLDGSIPGEDRDSELRAVDQARETATGADRWFFEFALACIDWPDADRFRTPTGPFTATGIPTMVVAAEADPATPYSGALGLLSQLDDGRLLSVTGGSHVMYGFGVGCVDRAVNRFITTGESADRVDCETDVVAPYVPIMSPGGDMAQVLTALDNELTFLPELFWWDGYMAMSVGCNLGGGVTFTGTDTLTEFRFDECAMGHELVINGSGLWDFERSLSRMEVSLSGDPCTYHFEQDWGRESGAVDTDCT